MNIGVDATIIQIDTAGSGIYAKELINHLRQEFPNNEYLAKSAVRKRKNPGQKTIIDRLLNIYIGTIWEFFTLPVKIFVSHPDIFHALSLQAPIYCNCPLIVTILDPSILLFPQYFNWWFRNHSRYILPLVARRADKIITISEFSKNEIHRYLNIPLEKIVVTYVGVSSLFTKFNSNDPRIANFCARNQIEQPFILHVGSFEPRKNIPALLEAYAILKKKGVCQHSLVFTGGTRWKSSGIISKIEELRLQNDISILGYIPEEELPVLYNAADLLVYPSLYEGFGMPVVEAMACGCPIITSNIASLPEITGTAGIMVNPNDYNELADAISMVIQDSQLKQKMRQQGLEQAKFFSWERCAQQTMSIYKQVTQK
jgi:glycosyltransferase involved in cell wall biosynthesis